MVLKPTDNLKGFACQRPPFVIFMVCLLLFAIALISLGLYIQHHPVPSLDDKDWNDFLKDFSAQKFCIPLNDTSHFPSTDPSTPHSQIPTTQETESFLDITLAQNVSYMVNLEYPAVNPEKQQHLADLSSLMSSVPAQQLKLNKRYQDVDMIFQLTHPLDNSNCKDDKCKVSACLSVALPPGAYSELGNLHPRACNKTTSHGIANPWMMHPKMEDEAAFCAEGIQIHTEYRYNPRLTVYLDQAEKSIINLHLMYTSYFLFIMLITCVFYALVKGPPFKSRGSSHENGVNRKLIVVEVTRSIVEAGVPMVQQLIFTQLGQGPNGTVDRKFLNAPKQLSPI